MLGILDLRSLGYYEIKQSILQQNLSKHDRFKLADVLCKQFRVHKYIKERKKERKEETKKYPWLDSSHDKICVR